MFTQHSTFEVKNCCDATTKFGLVPWSSRPSPWPSVSRTGASSETPLGEVGALLLVPYLLFTGGHGSIVQRRIQSHRRTWRGFSRRMAARGATSGILCTIKVAGSGHRGQMIAPRIFIPLVLLLAAGCRPAGGRHSAATSELLVPHATQAVQLVKLQILPPS